MRKQTILGAALAAVTIASTPALADNGIARLTAVSGNVLVSNDFNIATAGEALRLAPGMRVLVTMNSAATVEFDDGCRVPVAAGERFEIQSATPCAQRKVRQRGSATHVAAVAR
jgi:hypothetical protein